MGSSGVSLPHLGEIDLLLQLLTRRRVSRFKCGELEIEISNAAYLDALPLTVTEGPAKEIAPPEDDDEDAPDPGVVDERRASYFADEATEGDE